MVSLMEDLVFICVENSNVIMVVSVTNYNQLYFQDKMQIQNKIKEVSSPPFLENSIKTCSIGSISLRGIKESKMKQAKRLKVPNNRFQTQQDPSKHDQNEKNHLLSTQASQTNDESMCGFGFKRKVSMCEQVKQREYLARLRQSRYGGESSVLFLTSSEPETLMDFNNTCFIQRTYNSNKANKLRSQLITYSLFNPRKTQPITRGRQSVTQMVGMKLAALRKYENSKLLSHDVIAECAPAIKYRKSNKRMARMFSLQQYQHYDALLRPTHIQF